MHYNHIAYADGRLARKTFSNGTETSYAYNAEGHLAELTHRDREGILDRYVYGYDLMGNRTAMEKHRRGLNWKKATANPYVLFAGNAIINTGAYCTIQKSSWRGYYRRGNGYFRTNWRSSWSFNIWWYNLQ